MVDVGCYFESSWLTGKAEYFKANLEGEVFELGKQSRVVIVGSGNRLFAIAILGNHAQ